MDYEGNEDVAEPALAVKVWTGGSRDRVSEAGVVTSAGKGL